MGWETYFPGDRVSAETMGAPTPDRFLSVIRHKIQENHENSKVSHDSQQQRALRPVSYTHLYMVRHARITDQAITLASVNGFVQTFPAVLGRAALPSLKQLSLIHI